MKFMFINNLCKGLFSNMRTKCEHKTILTSAIDRRCSVENGVLKNLTNFTGKHLA